MQAAQRLFQDGHISYHRTDSTTLEREGAGEAARAIRELFGDAYLQRRRAGTRPRSRTRRKRTRRFARPISRGTLGARTRSLDRDDLRLYELIWKRTMASQMVDARVLRTTIEITAPADDGEPAVFTASGKVIEFAGFRRAYVEGSDDPAAELERAGNARCRS